MIVGMALHGGGNGTADRWRIGKGLQWVALHILGMTLPLDGSGGGAGVSWQLERYCHWMAVGMGLSVDGGGSGPITAWRWVWNGCCMA